VTLKLESWVEMTVIAAATVGAYVYTSLGSSESDLDDASSSSGDDKDTLSRDSFEPAPVRSKGVRFGSQSEVVEFTEHCLRSPKPQKTKDFDGPARWEVLFKQILNQSSKTRSAYVRKLLAVEEREVLEQVYGRLRVSEKSLNERGTGSIGAGRFNRRALGAVDEARALFAKALR